MNAGRPRLLRQPGDQLFDLFAGDHHQVGQLVDDDNDVGYGAERFRAFRRQRQRVGQARSAFFAVADAAVEAGNIAHAQRRHQFVAPLHFADAPVEGVGRLLHVDDDRREQVGNAFVDREFEHFRVDQDQPHVFRLGLVEQGKNHRIDADRLARAGGAGDQQMRHLGQIDDHRLAADVLAERHRQRRVHVVIGRAGNDFGQPHRLPPGIRQLQRHARFAGHRLDNADRNHRQRARQILGKIDDLRALDTDGRFDFIACDDRAGIGRQHLDLDAEFAQLALDQARGVFQRFDVDLLGRLRRRFQ